MSSSSTTTMATTTNVSPLLCKRIRKFLIDYQCEIRYRKMNPPSSSMKSNTYDSSSSSSRIFSSLMAADPTTANALQTSTVVLRKKNKNKKNSSFDGIPISNYRIHSNNLYAEIFDWIYHFLWLKNCPIELATIVAIKIATRMSQEIINEFNHSLMINNNNNNNNNHQLNNNNNNYDELQMDKSPALSSPTISSSTTTTMMMNDSMSMMMMMDNNNQSTSTTTTIGGPSMEQRSSLSTGALCSVDLSRQSRELMDECLDDLGNNPDRAISMVNDYLDNNNAVNDDDDGGGGGSLAKNEMTNNNNQSMILPFTTSVSAIKNRRQSMEDRHIIIQNLNKALGLTLPKTYSYYAIFDGHAGIDAASYSTAHLHHYLVESDAFINGGDMMEQAFREAFHKTDELYIKRLREDGVDKLKPSGTTALCALIEDNKTVYLAWAGDSQAVLVRNGCHEEIMLPHKPDMESERIRIQDQGGLVIYMDTWRVNGILSVTRAIGDPEHKALIIADPSFSSFEIDQSLDFLVLGCDGLFDHLNGQDITSHVFEYLCKNENNDPETVIAGVSAYLSEQAIQEGSGDNITSIVIFFKPFEQLVATGFPSTATTMTNHDEESIVKSEEKMDLTNDSDGNLSMIASLSTKNGGHFPYTDFSELPIGTKYRLTSNENPSPMDIVESSSTTPVPPEQPPTTPTTESIVPDTIDTMENLNNRIDNMESLSSSSSSSSSMIVMESESKIIDNEQQHQQQQFEQRQEHPMKFNDNDDEDELNTFETTTTINNNKNNNNYDESDDLGDDERCQDEFDFVPATTTTTTTENNNMASIDAGNCNEIIVDEQQLKINNENNIICIGDDKYENKAEREELIMEKTLLPDYNNDDDEDDNNSISKPSANTTIIDTSSIYPINNDGSNIMDMDDHSFTIDSNEVPLSTFTDPTLINSPINDSANNNDTGAVMMNDFMFANQISFNDESNDLMIQTDYTKPMENLPGSLITPITTTTTIGSQLFEMDNDPKLDEKLIDSDFPQAQAAAVATVITNDDYDIQQSMNTTSHEEKMNDIIKAPVSQNISDGIIDLNNDDKSIPNGDLFGKLDDKIVNDIEDSKMLISESSSPVIDMSDNNDDVNRVKRSVPEFVETNLDEYSVAPLSVLNEDKVQLPLVEPLAVDEKKEIVSKVEEIPEKVLEQVPVVVTSETIPASVAPVTVPVKSTVPSKATIKTAAPSTTTTTTTTGKTSNNKTVAGTKTLAPKTTATTRPAVSSRLTTATKSSNNTKTTTGSKPAAITKTGDKKPVTSTALSSRLTSTNRSTGLTNRPTASTRTTTTSGTTTVAAAKPSRTALTNRSTTTLKTTATTAKSTLNKPATTSTLTTAPKTTRATTTAVPKTTLKPKTSTNSASTGSSIAARKPLSTSASTGNSIAARKPLSTSTTATKVGSIRPAATTKTSTTTPGTTASKAATNLSKQRTTTTTMSSTLKKTTTATAKTGVRNNNTQNDVKKSVPKIPKSSSTMTATKNGISNGTAANTAVPKPPSTLTTTNYAHKRSSLISPENSLKQELEEAALNEMNALTAATAATLATLNGSN
nr:flocculation protein FLO11-like [Dermatophagoides farinae]